MSAINDLLDLQDNARLELSLQTRETIVRGLMSEGIPKDKNDRELLIKALDGLDRTILTKAKIKSDDTALKTQKDTTKLIAEVLNRFTVLSSSANRTGPVMLSSDIEINDIVEGETDIGIQTFTYDEFMKD